jgi:geranylgeranyl diphosphate synthase type II
MYSKKTGALLKAAAHMGCLLAGAREDDIAAALEFAGYMGMAYQIVDDILDVTGEETLLGKPIGSDEGNAKSTYVSLVGLETAKSAVRTLNESAKKALGRLPGDTRFLMGFADMLTDRQK